MSTPALVVNRLKHSPASTFDQQVLAHLALTVNVVSSAPPGQEKEWVATAIKTGAGIGPDNQGGRQERTGGGGFDSLAMIGRRIWRDVDDLTEVASRMSERVRRLHGFPNPTGLAWFCALVCTIDGGRKKDLSTGKVRGLPSVFRLTMATRAVLIAVPHTQAEAIAGAEFRTHDDKGKQLPGRGKGVAGWEGSWSIEKAWAMATRTLAEKEIHEEIRDRVDAEVIRYFRTYGKKAPKNWVAGARAYATAQVEATRDARFVEVTAYMAQARKEQEALGAAGLRLEGWHPGYQRTPWEPPADYTPPAEEEPAKAPSVYTPEEPQEDAEHSEDDWADLIARASKSALGEGKAEMSAGPVTRQSVRTDGPEPRDWFAYANKPARQAATRAAAEAAYGKPFSHGRAALVDEFILGWWEDHGQGWAQAKEDLRPIIANAIWPGGLHMTMDQLRWVGRQIGAQRIPWSEHAILIEMRNWSDSAEHALDVALARQAGGTIWTDMDGSPLNATSEHAAPAMAITPGGDQDARWDKFRAKHDAGEDPWA